MSDGGQGFFYGRDPVHMPHKLGDDAEGGNRMAEREYDSVLSSGRYEGGEIV